MPETNTETKRIQFTESERKTIHAILSWERMHQNTPTIAELAKYIGANEAGLGNLIRRMQDKGFLKRNKYKSFFINYKLVSCKSFVLMYDAIGCSEFTAQYGLKQVLIYARNMWEATRFATAIGEPDFIQKNKIACVQQKKDTSLAKK